MVYFLFLLIYSGLEFTLSFLTHLRFDYTRFVASNIRQSLNNDYSSFHVFFSFHLASMQQGKLYLFSGLVMTLIQGGLVRRVRAEAQDKLALNVTIFNYYCRFSISVFST